MAQLVLAIQVSNTHEGQLHRGYRLHWDLGGCPGSSCLIYSLTQVRQLVTEQSLFPGKVRLMPQRYGGGILLGSLPLHDPFCPVRDIVHQYRGLSHLSRSNIPLPAPAVGQL